MINQVFLKFRRVSTLMIEKRVSKLTILLFSGSKLIDKRITRKVGVDNEITVFDAEVSANKSSGNILQSNIIHQASRSKEPSQQYYSTATSPRFDFPVKQAKIKPYAGVSKINQR